MAPEEHVSPVIGVTHACRPGGSARPPADAPRWRRPSRERDHRLTTSRTQTLRTRPRTQALPPVPAEEAVSEPRLRPSGGELSRPSGPPCELETLAGGVPEMGVAPKSLLSKLAPAARLSASFLVSPALHLRSQLQMPPGKLPSLRTGQGQSWVGRGERRSLKSLFPRWERALGLGGNLYLSGSQSRVSWPLLRPQGPSTRKGPTGPCPA